MVLHGFFCKSFLQVTKEDTKVELDTYKQTRQGLDEMYSDVWKQLKEEKKFRLVRKLTVKSEMKDKGFCLLKVALQV